jgi:hypothetical protein
MKTVVSPLARTLRSSGAGLTEAKPRRRWPRVLLWIVMIALVVYLAAFAAFVSRYQPLTADTLGAAIDRRQVIRSVDATTPGGSAFTQYRVGAVQGRRFYYGFTLSNNGRLPVTISDIGTDPRPGDILPLAQTGVRVGPSTASGRVSVEETAAFGSPGHEPFTLGAGGDSRFVVIDTRISNCQRDGATYTYGTVDITYRVVGLVRKHATLALPYTIQIPGDAACTEPAGGAGQNS